MRCLAFFALMLLCVTPVRAGTDETAVQSIITSQMEALGRDDAEVAFSLASPTIHEIFQDPNIFLHMVQQGYAPVYRHKSVEFGESRGSAPKIAQIVHIIDADGVAWEALYSLEQQPDGSWKISGCALLKATDGTV